MCLRERVRNYAGKLKKKKVFLCIGKQIGKPCMGMKERERDGKRDKMIGRERNRRSKSDSMESGEKERSMSSLFYECLC